METLSHILTSHFTRYPGMQVQDLYKLLHQAALGSEHAARDEKETRDGLMRELAEMGTGPDDPLLDPISPDGQILRIHLRPYLRTGMEPETLLQAFIQTANEWQGSSENLKEFAAGAAGWMQLDLGKFLPEEIKTYFAKMETQDFPALHHSANYERLYRPAYRVIARQYLEKI